MNEPQCVCAAYPNWTASLVSLGDPASLSFRSQPLPSAGKRQLLRPPSGDGGYPDCQVALYN